MSLPDVFGAFPEAKKIGAEVSQEKMKMIKAVEKYDFISTDSKDLEKANEQLKEEGVELVSLEGDIAADALFCIVDNDYILETDVLYG